MICQRHTTNVHGTFSIINMLKINGFPITFVSWIKLCITTVSYKIVINGQSDGILIQRGEVSDKVAHSLPFLFFTKKSDHALSLMF